ncbi:MAG: quinolinate synthase NadA [Armatimonadota bacterium]|nr:quinolinate synthase NadA [Armatimonadota bacterium]
MRLPVVAGAEVPSEYLSLTDEEMIQRIEEHKARLGQRLIILTHQYQRPEIVDRGDYVGDSFELSRKAAQSQAEYIVFCGVQFMAQSAEILRKDFQKVYHPDLTSGCPMADMGDMDDVEFCWSQITEIVGKNRIVPITYMNSFADLKAFVGRNGGAVCTSSNARAVLEWAFRHYEKVLFLPDEHLGRFVAKRIGIARDGWSCGTLGRNTIL